HVPGRVVLDEDVIGPAAVAAARWFGHQFHFAAPDELRDVAWPVEWAIHDLHDSALVTNRGGALFAHLKELVKSLEPERLQDLGRLARRHRLGHALAADRRRLEPPGAPAGIEVVVFDRCSPHDGAEI